MSVARPDPPAPVTDLPVARASADAILQDTNGTPVWPCVDEDDCARLEGIARVFGRATTRVDARAATAAESADRVVTGTGPGVEALARLYAHLTGRRYERAATAVDAAGTDGVEVVLHVGPHAPHDLLDELVARQLNARVGVLWATDAEALRKQALVRAAAARLAPLSSGRAVVLSPVAGPIEPLRVGPIEVHGSTDDPQRIEALADAAVVALTTHSDGIDAMLGPRLTLCALIDLSRDEQLRAAPQPKCIRTGVCHRHSLPLEEALGSGRLVSARRFASRAVVWNTCFGVMGRTWSVADTWGLLPQLLATPRVGAFVVLRAIVNTGTSAVIPLVADLHRGRPVAGAVESWRKALEGSPSAMVGQRVFVFGDPRVVANPEPDDAIGEAFCDHPAAPDILAPRTTTAEGGMIRRFLADTLASPTSPAEHVQACWSALDRFELEIASTTALRSYTAAARAFRSALLGVMSRVNWSSWTDSWMHAATLHQPLPGTRCPDCHAEWWAGLYRPRPPASALRYYANCANCGAVDDRPDLDHAVIKRLDRGLRLDAGGPRNDWTGALVSVPVGPDLESMEWPSDGDGRPVRECAMDQTAHVGPVFRLAIFIEGWRVSVFMRRGYVDPAPDTGPR